MDMDPYPYCNTGKTGKTCLGGGMQCPSASGLSNIFSHHLILWDSLVVDLHDTGLFWWFDIGKEQVTLVCTTLQSVTYSLLYVLYICILLNSVISICIANVLVAADVATPRCHFMAITQDNLCLYLQQTQIPQLRTGKFCCSKALLPTFLC